MQTHKNIICIWPYYSILLLIYPQLVHWSKLYRYLPTSKEPEDTELLTNFLQEDIKNIELKIHTIF